MNIESIPVSLMQSVPKITQAEAVIQLNEIKSILYLSLKGEINLNKIETHTIDIFA